VIKVGIIGATGYTGMELIRLLRNHPVAKVTYAASRNRAGEPLRNVMKSVFKDELCFEPVDLEAIFERCDVIFTAVPHGAAMDIGKEACQRNKPLIDLGTDFRFKDHSVFERWYGHQHTCPEILNKASYGLPELFREKIVKSSIVGNPGCYPTSILLGLAPLIKEGLIDMNHINIFSMSGHSGAGATLKESSHLPLASENVAAYGVGNHRHTPEIEQGIAFIAGLEEVPAVSFTPHLVPMSRGILSTMVCSPVREVSQNLLYQLYREFYSEEVFVTVLDEGQLPQTKPLRGTNLCHLNVNFDKRAERILVVSAIDNIGKGACGQAIQNMNILFGLAEHQGLELDGLYP
jgi:N-acetyl-gamma-glutamyl-phosphate reductase